MFAVPGWSVKAEGLKAETATPKDNGAGNNTQNNAKSKKRKRNNKSQADENVTAANVADMWETVIEGKPKAAPANQQRKGKKDNQKKGGNDQSKAAGEGEGEGEAPKSKKQKKNKKGSSKEGADAVDDKKDLAADIPPVVPEPPKLTPLQASMRDKLVSARFRHLNETLYTRPSEEAFQLFDDSPEMFNEYHEGFRRQVKVWPENPVDSFLKDIRTRAKIRQPDRRKGGAPPTLLEKTHLPRTTGTCVIADLGCGDARLAGELQKDKGKLKLDVKSFDLQSPSPLVTKADIANLPVGDDSVNVAIFCLALMGTNWLDFIEEAYRILHWKGELWVAEIKSRFTPPNKTKVVAHSVGARNKKNVKKGGKEDDDRDEDLMVEVDGVDDRRRETDVSAFVEALRKRGFVPTGAQNEAIDMSNKMFVKMRFIKGAPATVGKCVKAEAPPKGQQKKMKWPIGNDEDDKKDQVDEKKILKACLYKIR